jgi:hypothetical protein
MEPFSRSSALEGLRNKPSSPRRPGGFNE